MFNIIKITFTVKIIIFKIAKFKVLEYDKLAYTYHNIIFLASTYSS